MRLFFALLPDADTCRRLAIAADDLKIAAGARLLTPESFHRTLAFVGDVRESEVTHCHEMGAALRVPQCMIALDACEYWPSSHAGVLAARVNPCALMPVLEQLHAVVIPRKSWCAHATLARKVAQAPVLTAMSVSLMSRSFALMRSATKHGHAVYTVVDSWGLLDKA